MSFAYDENRRMTRMTTVGLGTNFFTYTDAGNPQAEYGLWSNDSVSNSYHASVPRLKTVFTVV